jgi:hypothetical protein
MGTDGVSPGKVNWSSTEPGHSSLSLLSLTKRVPTPPELQDRNHNFATDELAGTIINAVDFSVFVVSMDEG